MKPDNCVNMMEELTWSIKPDENSVNMMKVVIYIGG